MILQKKKIPLLAGSILQSLAKSLIVVGLFSGCGSADDRFAAESFDEYTEPLTDTVIGTPDGVVVRAAPAPDVDGGSGGAAGSSGTGTGGSSTMGAGGGVAGAAGRAGATGTGGAIGGVDAGTGGFPDGGSDDGAGFGFWHFDDCSPTSNFLTDSSGFGANAQQALGAACVPGISGQGVQIRTQRDVVQVPDEPQFTVSSRVAVAAWVNPNTVSGNQPIIIKRLNNKTSFSLGIHNGNIEMSVVLSTGTTVISRAPIAAGTFTHVAGMFDGTFVFLFINGQQFGQIFAAGTLRNVFAPIRIGATTQSQHFDGIIDEVFLSTQAISKDDLIALSCIHHPTTFTVNPASSGPVPPNTPVLYDVAVTNNDVGACGDTQYNIFINGVEPGISAFFFNNFQSVPPGGTVDFTAQVTGSEDADPGEHRVGFNLFAFTQRTFDQFFGQLIYELTAPTGCFVSSRRELMITNLSVVDDPVRTAGNGTGTNTRGDGGVIIPPPADGGGGGVWSLGHLMRELAPTPESAPAMMERVLKSFTTAQVVNGFTIAPRVGMQPNVLDGWPRTPDGQLDLDRAPVTLQAIVNRIDIRDLSLGSGGEGRFVFGINNSQLGFAMQATMIFEYNLPAQTEEDVLGWANRWHGLQNHPFPSEEYNTALEDITRRFTSRGASPGSVNGSALFSFRTNEIDLGGGAPWELRQFDLSPDDGFFRQVPLAGTPDLGFNGTQTFADFVNQNADAIKAVVPAGVDNTVPLVFEGQNFQAGTVFNNLQIWSAPGIVDPEARFHASLNTCNGCHGPEVNTTFLQISPRGLSGGGEAQLSPFIAGTTVFDPITGQPRTINDLGRRRVDLTSLVCPPDPDAGPPPPPRDAGVPTRDAMPAPPGREAGAPMPTPEPTTP
jgi:hypothetical protein